MTSLVLFNERGGLPFDLARQKKIDNTAGTTWSGNAAGISGLASGTSDYWIIGAQSLVPTGRVTVAIIRQKTDTTARPSSTFSHSGATVGDLCSAQLPYNDGIVKFYFGGTTAPNQLTWSGYTITTNVERWVFVAGMRGSAIYLNGVQVASQATAVTRTNTDGSTFALNQGVGFGVGGDLQHFNFAMAQRRFAPAAAPLDMMGASLF